MEDLSMQQKAQESKFVQKARQKLRKQLNELEKLVTSDALDKMTQEMYRWISINSKNRKTLKNKNISLFDGNQNSAKVNNVYVKNLIQQLYHD
jgi:hypothetical protein